MLAQNPGHCNHWPSQFYAGQAAFKRGELPQQDWPQTKRDGWNYAGEAAFLSAMADEAESKRQRRSTAEYMLSLIHI